MTTNEGKLWGGRFAGGPSLELEALSRSTHFDWRLVPYDLAGSVAHAHALHRAGLLTDADQDTIVDGLLALRRAYDEGSLRPGPDDEDVHGALERLLIERVGAEAGAREMLEETGIVVSPDDLVGPYHRGFHEFSWNGWDIANDSHFFAVRVDDVSVSFDGLEPMEVGNVLDSGWWSPDAMPDQLSNAELPAVARLAVEAVGL